MIVPREEARRFFFSLYRGGPGEGEWYELRCLDCRGKRTRKGPREFYRSITNLVEAAMHYRDQWDVYFGVGYRRCPATTDMTECPHEKRGLDHVSRLPAIWVDVDVQSPDEPKKRFPTLLDGLDALYGLDQPPPVIVGSGAGLHAYWPLPGATNDLERIAGLNQRIAHRLQVDNCGDVPRILRVPGTFNHKHGAPLPVQLIEAPEVDRHG